MKEMGRILVCGLGQGRLYSHLGCIHYRPVRLIYGESEPGLRRVQLYSNVYPRKPAIPSELKF